MHGTAFASTVGISTATVKPVFRAAFVPALQQALVAAETLDQELEASQSDVDAAAKSLNNAVSNLKTTGSSSSSTEPTKPVDPGKPATFTSDTTHDLGVSGSYQFKITSKDGQLNQKMGNCKTKLLWDSTSICSFSTLMFPSG